MTSERASAGPTRSAAQEASRQIQKQGLPCVTDRVLKASPKQMALEEREHHLPTKQLSGFKKKRNAKRGLSPQYASNS